MKNLTFFLVLFLGLSACNQVENQVAKIKKEYYGTTKGRKEVDRYTLSNESGMNVEIITYGGIITNLHVPNAAGSLTDVVLGYDNLSDYEKGSHRNGKSIKSRRGFGICRGYKGKAKQKTSSASVYDPTGGLQEPSNRGIY